MVIRTAILVDGGFYRKKAKNIFGDKSPQERADELEEYCKLHLKEHDAEIYLYRIFYYDCPASNKNIFHPLTKKNVDLRKSPSYKWSNDFLRFLKKRRKFAVRLGRLSDNEAQYSLSSEATRKLLNGTTDVSQLTESDFELNMKQKSVDMKLGLDISTMALKKQVDQIILIAGDSDFVPAAKLARREGVDFILDSMGSHINDDLMEHIDGLRNKTYEYKKVPKKAKTAPKKAQQTVIDN
ncbi:MAG: NYN domain-containing protein [Clostridia bacterium]|nr:NYN domain-containing protein [Clostridia bacterium]